MSPDESTHAPIRLTGGYHQCCSPPEHPPRRIPLVDLIDQDELDRWNAANERSRDAYYARFTKAGEVRGTPREEYLPWSTGAAS